MFEQLAQSTWGVPAVGALHVLGVAWFGGLVFVEGLRKWRWFAAAYLGLTGLALFLANPTRTWDSGAFRIKLGLLAVILVLPARARGVTIVLFAAVILAARGIAYF
jgi:hypothetical protein